MIHKIRNCIVIGLNMCAFISCECQPDIREIIWEEVIYNSYDSISSKRLYKIEKFDSGGILIYDSIIFENNNGYRANKYNDNNVIFSKTVYAQSETEVMRYSYDDISNLKQIEFIFDDSLSVIDYLIIEENKFKLPTNILLKYNGKANANIYRSYDDALLTEEKIVYLENFNTSEISEDTYLFYDENGLLKNKLFIDNKSSVKDSILYLYDNRNMQEIRHFSQIRGEEYMLRFIEKRIYNKNQLIEYVHYDKEYGEKVHYKANIKYW